MFLEEVENVKSLKTDGHLYKKWSEKTFSSDELIKKPQGYIPVEKGERLRVPNDTGVVSCRASSRQPYKLITQQNNTCMFLAFKNALLKCSNKNQILLK